MSAEETLVFVRLGWRSMFDELMMALTNSEVGGSRAMVDAIRKINNYLGTSVSCAPGRHSVSCAPKVAILCLVHQVALVVGA